MQIFLWLAAIPRFLTHLGDQHIREHDTATFTCDVYPSKTAVSWSIKGQAINDSKKYKISSINNERKLLVKDIKEEDANIITASVGEASTNARLTVEGDFLHLLGITHIYFFTI